jgi:ABC-type bacteriocin/lantibiotic exporter with double-glycine peptidase domain
MALEALSFAIQPGELAALVGPRGAGKTTITYLLPRLYDPTAGTIRLDGHDLRDLSQVSLARAIGMVTQEPYLFNDTLNSRMLASDRFLRVVQMRHPLLLEGAALRMRLAVTPPQFYFSVRLPGMQRGWAKIVRFDLLPRFIFWAQS